MSKKKKKNTPKTWTEVFMSQRKDWGEVYPVTRVIPDKRHKPPKHKGKELE